MKDEIKVIKLMQQESLKVDSIHSQIGQDLESLKAELLKALNNENTYLDINTPAIENKTVAIPLNKKSFSEIVDIANREISHDVSFRDILSNDDLIAVNNKVNSYVETFNKKHQLDNWDYAIGGGVGLFCGILDILFVQKPPKPTILYSQKIDGLFNQWSQSAINNLIPPDLAKLLEKSCKIGGTDSRLAQDFISPISGKFNLINHRFKSLNHDPILACFIGALDVMNGTCTIVDNGSIKVLQTVRGASGDYNFFEALGMMIGHLASDVNTPSAIGNRGMGIPAPLMGLFGTLKGVKIGDADIANLAEYMYVSGYDARHFLTMSIPCLIGELLTRLLYIIKEIKCNKKTFVDAFKETLPFNLSRRFRMLLNISYGTMVAVNAGKIALTNNILNANYTMWITFTWHTFHSLHWLLWAKNTELQKYIDSELSKELNELQLKIDELTEKAELLPI
ncbi:MAG: hypothetical protein PHN45_01415 [Methylococcales bacterium]|nr:hypothetical protein [Methylococcales bacterium]MDD5753399.1 hypothetical protein [Methylococcales bacterium]